MADTFTPNLAIIHLQPQQFSPDVVVNVALDTLDLAMTGLLLKTITSTNVTLSAAEAASTAFVRVTGLFTGNRNLIVPATPKFYTVSHEGTGNFSLTVKTASGSGVSILQGTLDQVYCDGVNVITAAGVSGGAGSGIYDLPFSIDGKPSAGAILTPLVMVRAVRLPQNFAGSRGVVLGVPAAASAVFTVKKNATSIGTTTFAIGASTATFTSAANVDYAIGDVFSVIAPSPQDANLADVAITIVGIRL